jgi:uncharacterized membrane protein YphA (DoxX/SURF4 family)
MNIFLWILQILLALHTVMGAVWKFSHSAEQTMPSLKAIPSGIWWALAGVELLCALCLILPALYKPAAVLVPVAATCIAVIIVLLCDTFSCGKYRPGFTDLLVGCCGAVCVYCLRQSGIATLGVNPGESVRRVA